MPIPLLVFAAASAGLSALGAYQRGQAQAGALAGQAAQAEVDTAATEIATAFAVRRSREASARTLGEIRARAAASGLPMAGSPLEVLAEATRQAELDVQAIEFEGRTQARRLRSQAGQFRRQARQAGRAGALSALTSVAQAGASFGAAGGFKGATAKSPFTRYSPEDL